MIKQLANPQPRMDISSQSRLITIQSLDISGNEIGAKGAVDLSASLTQLTALQSFSNFGNATPIL